MFNVSDARRGSGIRWLVALSLGGSLVTSTAELAAQDLRPFDGILTIDPLEGARPKASKRPRDAALTALIQRLNAANQIAAAQMTLLRDRLEETGRQLVDARAARARAEARLENLGIQLLAAKEEGEEMRARVAALDHRLRERDRQLEQASSWRADAIDLQRRLDAAEAALTRELTSDRRAADLAALLTTAETAARLARENLIAIDHHVRKLDAARGAVPDAFAGLAEQQSAALADVCFDQPQTASGPDDVTPWTANYVPAEFGEESPDWRHDIALEQAPKLAVSDLLAQFGRTDDRRQARDPEAGLPIKLPQFKPTADHAPDRRDALEGRWPRLRPNDDPAELMALSAATSRIADGLRNTRQAAVARQKEQVFMVDVEQRQVASSSSDGLVPLDQALNMRLYTARSELIDESKGRIRFFSDGSSTGGQIDLEVAGGSAAVRVHWANGRVTVER